MSWCAPSDPVAPLWLQAVYLGPLMLYSSPASVEGFHVIVFGLHLPTQALSSVLYFTPTEAIALFGLTLAFLILGGF